MAEDVKQEMNSTPGCIPSKWTRNTVADGDWLQKYTIAPLSSRDNFLADKISGAELNIDEEIEARKAGDAYLSANLTGFSAEYFDFKDNVETSAENLSAALSAEIVRAKNVETNLDSRINTERTDRINEDAKLQSQLDILKAATDVIDVWGSYAQFSENSATKYFPSETSALITDNDIIKIINDEYTPVTDTGNPTTGHQTYYQWKFNTPTPAQPGPDDGYWTFIGYTDPYYNIDEVDNLFDNMSATIADTYLSANTTAVQPGHNIQISANPTNPYILIETKDNVTFDGVSSTTLSATTAYGSSAKFDNISSTSLTALTATGNSAKFTNVSSQNLTSTNINATTTKSTYFSGNTLSGDTLYSTIDTLIGSAQSGAAASAWLADNTEGTSAKYAKSAGSATSAASADKANSATVAYQAQNLGNVGSANVIGSAQSGKFAWNVINSAIVTGYNGNTPNTAYLSGGFAIKAGDNLTLTYENKTFTLNAGDTGITAISAGNTKYTGPVFSASAGTGINFVNDSNNVLGIKASNSLINSATGGSAAYNWITAQSATLYAGSGINFYNAGSNRLGIAVNYSTATEDSTTYVTALNNIPLSAGMKYENGNYIEVNNTTKKINLSSNIIIEYMSATSAFLSANYTGGIYSNYLTPSSTRFTFGFGSTILSLTGIDLSNASTTIHIPWLKLNNDYVLTTGNASGSKLSANTAVTLVVTSRLPNVLEADTYYIV